MPRRARIPRHTRKNLPEPPNMMTTTTMGEATRWTADAEHCLFRKADPGEPGDWHTALLEPGLGCDYLKSALCPCAVFMDITDLMGDHLRNSGDSWSTRCCMGDIASCCIAAPLLFCFDQFGTRASDRLRGYDDVPVNMSLTQHLAPPPIHNPNGTGGHAKDYELAGQSWANFTQRLPSFLNTTTTAQQQPQEQEEEDWTQDAIGYKLDGRRTPEDWWPASYCCFYLREALYATCVTRECMCADDMPRLPLCFSLMSMLLYPFVVCPTALFMRRQVMDRMHIQSAESWGKSLAIVCCCLPCGLTQTLKELELPHAGHAATGLQWYG